MPRQNAQGLSSANIGAEYMADEKEFLGAMAAYMALHKRRFPSFTEVLAVAKSLGYRKVAESTIHLPETEVEDGNAD